MASVVVAIFPLPDVTLFPATILPLHVFEARYRALVTDALARARAIAVVQLRPGYEATYEGKPAVHAVAGAGEIVSAQRLPTGRYDILVRGERRVRIRHEIPGDTLYRIVVADVLEDRLPSGDVSARLARLRAACRALLDTLGRPTDVLDAVFAEAQPPGVIADRVTGAVLPGATLRQELLETLDVEQRLDRVAGAVEDLLSQMKGKRA